MSVYMYILRYIVQCPVQRTVNSEHWISLFLCFANKTLQKDFVYLELYRASYNVYKYMNCNINISGYLKLNFNLFSDRNICTALLFANQKQNCWVEKPKNSRKLSKVAYFRFFRKALSSHSSLTCPSQEPKLSFRNWKLWQNTFGENPIKLDQNCTVYRALELGQHFRFRKKIIWKRIDLLIDDCIFIDLYIPSFYFDWILFEENSEYRLNSLHLKQADCLIRYNLVFASNGCFYTRKCSDGFYSHNQISSWLKRKTLALLYFL